MGGVKEVAQQHMYLSKIKCILLIVSAVSDFKHQSETT